MRSLSKEFFIAEETFDNTKNLRNTVTKKLMDAVEKIELVDENGALVGEAGDKLQIFKTALSALNDVEKASSSMVSLKLKMQEQQQAASTAATDRINAVIAATRPGMLADAMFSQKDLDECLEQLKESIHPGELKASSRDLSD